MTIPKIKICGLTNMEDADFASQMGADILGVVLAENSPRRGTASLVRQLASRGFRVAGVYTSIDSIIEHISDETYVQIHFPHGESEIDFVKNKLRKKVISVIFPERETDFPKKAENLLKSGADMVLVDFGTVISVADENRIPDFSGKTIGVAGKIYIDNIRTALRFNPGFIDLSSRLEKYPGKKDHDRIRTFMEAFNSESATV